VRAVKTRYPHAIIQWEDFAKDTAFAVLERYRNEVPSFNDDIQGTGATALAGVLGACRLRGERLRDQRIVVHGAGAGGAGVAWALREGMVKDGLSLDEARARVFVLDSKGLLVESRTMEEYKRPFAQLDARVAGWAKDGGLPSLVDTIANAKATVLLGLSGQGHAFNEPVLKAMRASTERPVVFPLSNPTSASEALPEEVFATCGDGAIVATGSPFPPVKRGAKTLAIGQGNNAFVFPGLGFGSILAGAQSITDAMVLESAYALADYTKEKHGGEEAVYPPVSELREASVRVAARVLAQARKDGVARHPWPQGSEEAHVRARARNARYLPMHRAKGRG
jgi:malate dehydrogenase (oxaloacetate-decarboxylating)